MCDLGGQDGAGEEYDDPTKSLLQKPKIFPLANQGPKAPSREEC